jgi:serine/threonine-protein kinase
VVAGRLDPGAIVGSYRVEGFLGRGGMATVYAARHVELNRPVAVKLLSPELAADPDFVERFRREGRLQASLEHPHIVPVHEAGESAHGLYLAMRLVEGPTLAALLAERALDGRRALALMAQVADALDAAHAAGLVHRDVKPHNILVSGDDAYLGDFGLTRAESAGAVTATGKLLGTVAYLAPEVIRGAPAEPASDRYAFAATLFECLTGTAVFPRRSETATLFAHTSEPVPLASVRRPELPPEVDDVFGRALAKAPGDRPATARAVVDGVARALDGGAALPPPPPPGAAALATTTAPALVAAGPAVASRRTLLPWLVVAALAGAGAAAAVAVVADDDPRPAYAPAVPATLPETTVLGSDLSRPGRALDCHGRTPGTSSPGCTIVQSALPRHTLVVPEDGVIRRWGVRSAQGELALVVVRPDGRRGHQVARSQNEFAGSAEVQTFRTNLGVLQGDRVGVLAVAGGTGVGVREVAGATTERWLPVLHGTQPSQPGFDGELLLRVEYEPGATAGRPRQVTGAAAERLHPGRVRVRRHLRFASGRRVTIALVVIDGRFAFDQFIRGRRTARIEVPDFYPDAGTIVDLEIYTEKSRPEQLGIYFEFTNAESARIRHHFYDVFPREFQLVE